MKITVMGLGYIGLPTAITLAEAGFEVCGFDVNKNTIETLQGGHIHIVEPGLQEAFEKAVAHGHLHFSEELGKSDVFYISVPTPFFKDENGSVYGVPNSVQSMGIIYNKTTIEKATGEEFDPSTIKSNADLDALCQKIQDGGVSPIMFTGVDWSLGSHFLSQVFNGIQGDEEAQKAFIDSVKDGSAELKTNDAWNGVMDTFDIIAKYNYNANDPLVGNTELDGQAMAKGDVAMWFMGDWGWSYLEAVANADDEYGIMPCPLTASADDAVNQELAVFPAKGYCVDGSQNDEAQQAAGKKLVEYLTIERAQDMSDALSIALPFKNVDVTVASPLANVTQAYVADGKVQSTYAFSALLPSDFWSENGAVMQQYLTGQMDRDAAADAIQAYWQAQ